MLMWLVSQAIGCIVATACADVWYARAWVLPRRAWAWWTDPVIFFIIAQGFALMRFGVHLHLDPFFWFLHLVIVGSEYTAVLHTCAMYALIFVLKISPTGEKYYERLNDLFNAKSRVRRARKAQKAQKALKGQEAQENKGMRRKGRKGRKGNRS